MMNPSYELTSYQVCWHWYISPHLCLLACYTVLYFQTVYRQEASGKKPKEKKGSSAADADQGDDGDAEDGGAGDGEGDEENEAKDDGDEEAGGDEEDGDADEEGD
jgi:hypothetical protein